MSVSSPSIEERGAAEAIRPAPADGGRVAEPVRPKSGAGALPAIHSADEPIVDAASFLQRSVEANGGVGKAEVSAFLGWMSKDLFSMVRFHRRAARFAPSLSGLAIYAPSSEEEAMRHASLEIYERSSLMRLWEKLNVAQPRRDVAGVR